MSEQQQQRTPESLRHEHTEVLLNMRHYSNLRFAIYSIFFAVMGGVGFVAFGKGQFDEHAALVARIAGILVIVTFWLYQERITVFFDHCHRIAVELERSLGYTLYSSRPLRKGNLPQTSVIWRVFFFLVMLLWLYAVFAVPLGS